MTESEFEDEIARLWPQPGEPPSRAAIDLCRRAVAEHPESSLFWYDLGIIMQRSDDDQGFTAEQYRQCFEKSVHCDPTYGEAYQELGYVLDTYFDDYERSEEAFRRAIALGAGYESYYGLALVLAEMGRTQEALSAISKETCPFHDHPEIEKLRLEILAGDWDPSKGKQEPT